MNLEEVLKTREEKWKNALKIALRSKGSAISVTLNSPGETKRDPETLKALALIVSDVLLALERAGIAFNEILFKNEGAYPYFVAGVRGDPTRVKKITIELEEKHPIGRLLDIDVLKADGSKISRRDLGLEERKCFLCDLSWIECRRNKKHSKGELKKFYRKALKSFLRGCESK